MWLFFWGGKFRYLSVIADTSDIQYLPSHVSSFLLLLPLSLSSASHVAPCSTSTPNAAEGPRPAEPSPHRCECEPWRPHLVHPPINLSLFLLLLLLLFLLLFLPPLQHHSSIPHLSSFCTTWEAAFFPPWGPPPVEQDFDCFSHCSSFSHLVSPARNRPVLQRLIRTGVDNQPATVLHFSVLSFGTLRSQYFLTADFYLEVFNVWPYHFEPAFIHMLRYVFTVSSFRMLSSDKLTTVIYFFLHMKYALESSSSNLVSGEFLNVLCCSIVFPVVGNHEAALL